MTLMCIACGERTLTIVKFDSAKASYGKRKDRALYECSNCGHTERVG